MKIFFFKRRALAAIAAVAVVAAMAAVTNLPSAITASATTRQLPIYCVDRDQKMVSISFDAAWGNGRMRRSAPGLSAGKGTRDQP